MAESWFLELGTKDVFLISLISHEDIVNQTVHLTYRAHSSALCHIVISSATRKGTILGLRQNTISLCYAVEQNR